MTDESGPDFIEPANRVATFDIDGTSWCEQPTYIQQLFVISRLREAGQADESLLSDPHYRAAAENDLEHFAAMYPGDAATLMKLVVETHAGMEQGEFERLAHRFLTEENHPRFGVPYTQLAYEPMVELFDYLGKNGFKVFVASAGGMSFVRTVSEEALGISRERVIGSNVTFETKVTETGPVLMRRSGLVDPIDDGPGKPVNIELHIGRTPVFAGGNTDGDIHMLRYSETTPHRSLRLVVHHDDAEREYEYKGAAARKVFELAKERGWMIVSIKRDWQKVFAWQ